MTDRHNYAAYDDLLDPDGDPRLSAVVRDLECVYPRVRPPEELVRRLRTAAARPQKSGMLDRLMPGRWLRARRPLVLAAAAVLAVAAAGGAGYAMHLFGGSSQVQLTSTCAGTSLNIAAPAFQVASPWQFVASGGRLIPPAVRDAAKLPHPQYWVVPAGADIVNTCRFKSVSQIEIGTNARTHTELEAIGVVPFSQVTTSWNVGSLLVPPGSDCPRRATYSRIAAPDGRPVAQLAQVPASLARSIQVTLPPCPGKQPRRTPISPPPSEDVSFRILSQIRYAGTEGSIVVLTARPSAVALKPGLNLGNRIGTLPDGTSVFNLCARDCRPNDLRWLKRGLIISVSGDLPLNRMKALASDVVVR